MRLPTLKTVFKAPEQAVIVGLAEAGAVFAIYSGAVPPHTDILAADPHNTDVEASRRRAARLAGGLLGLIFLITQDINAFVIGGAALAGMDLVVKHANAVSPTTGKNADAGDAQPADNDDAFPLPTYTESSDLDDPGY